MIKSLILSALISVATVIPVVAQEYEDDIPVVRGIYPEELPFRIKPRASAGQKSELYYEFDKFGVAHPFQHIGPSSTYEPKMLLPCENPDSNLNYCF